MGAAQSMTSTGEKTGDQEGPNPLFEMRISIQFGTLAALRTTYVGLLWGRLRDRYTQGIEESPLPTFFETFGGQPQMGFPQIDFQFGAPIPRIVFQGVDGDMLLHVQQDRLMLNWRRFPSGRDYPGYAAMRHRFATEIAEVQAFLTEEGLGEIQPNQCELTYLNALVLPDEAAVHKRLDRITPLWRDVDVGLPLESAVIQSHYVISSGGAPTGRLHTTFSPAVLTLTGEPNYQLEVVARSRPGGGTVAAAFAALDEAHDLIGRAFKDVTSSFVRASGDL